MWEHGHKNAWNIGIDRCHPWTFTLEQHPSQCWGQRSNDISSNYHIAIADALVMWMTALMFM